MPNQGDSDSQSLDSAYAAGFFASRLLDLLDLASGTGAGSTGGAPSDATAPYAAASSASASRIVYA